MPRHGAIQRVLASFMRENRGRLSEVCLAVILVCSVRSPTDSAAQTNVMAVARLSQQPTPCNVAVRGHYLYVGGGGAGLTIFDASDPTNPIDTGYVDSLGPSTAITISGDTIYRLGGTGYAGSLTILNLQNPTNPISVANIEGTFIQAKASSTRLYLNGFADSDTGLFVYDVSDPTNPVRIAMLSDFTPSTQVLGAAIGGWGLPTSWFADSTNVTGVGAVVRPNSLASSGNYIYTAEPSSIGVWDISNSSNAVPAGGLPTDSAGLGIAVSGGYAYVVGSAGLSIYSLGTLASPPLTIGLTPDALLCSWPTPTPAFEVQQNPDLDPTHWTTVTNGSVVIDAQNHVLLPKPEATMFYRLVSQ